MVDRRRVRSTKAGQQGDGPVIYVMSRDQRVDDNWALLFAQEIAIEQKVPVIVACPIAADYPDAPERQIEFSGFGLKQVESDLATLGIPFVASTGSSGSGVLSLIDKTGTGAVVTDFNPLRESRKWKSEMADSLNIPIYEVDAHSIVPCWEASGKQEYAAYTFRPKVNRRLSEFLTEFPSLVRHPFASESETKVDGWTRIDEVTGNANIGSAARQNRMYPGGSAAHKLLDKFLSEGLPMYNKLRNDPSQSGQSGLSPYLHFGQISAQRVALEAQRFDADIASLEAFLEELIVRRELSDNFCYYNDRYDSCSGFPEWARKTLDEHRGDAREYLYGREELEKAATHDELWNAAQTEMVAIGKMHGYMRMYWAKKILEWTVSPEEAMAHAVYLNNKYELDGNDPNGYAGIAWSIGGVHDRAWRERDVFGKIRYMSYAGCKRKFPVADYVSRISKLKSQVIG